ncbi:MAG TPA: ABC transporter permease [Thermoplasmata archaeon]|nr:ABC transporter permease [Thermoplasmata archaeon]
MSAPLPSATPPEYPRTGQVLPAFGILGWRWISRNPASTIAPIMLPFIFLYFLHLIAPASYFPLEVVGAMLFTTQNIGNWVLGDSATWRIEASLQDLFVASPMGKFRYLIGIAVSNLIPAAPALAVLAGILLYVDPASRTVGPWLVLLGVLIVLWVLFSAIGIAVSSRVKSQREIWPVGNLAFTVIGMLTPLYYPLSVLPGPWQYACHFVPSTYAALLVQGAFGFTPAPSATLVEYGILLLVLAVAVTLVALRLYVWGER